MKARSDELQVFVSVIESGSIPAAAEQLGLTEEGRFFLDHARAILERLHNLEEHLAQSRQKPAGRLRFNAASPFMLHSVVPPVGEFRRLYPDIQLELTSNDWFIDLLEQSTDIAIRIGELSDSTLHARSLGCSALNIVASPAYLQRHGTPASVTDLAGHTLLGFTRVETLNHWPLRHVGGDRFAIEPSIAASSGDPL